MMVASELPHFIGVDDDVLSTGVVLYHLQVRSKMQLVWRVCVSFAG